MAETLQLTVDITSGAEPTPVGALQKALAYLVDSFEPELNAEGVQVTGLSVAIEEGVSLFQDNAKCQVVRFVIDTNGPSRFRTTTRLI